MNHFLKIIYFLISWSATVNAAQNDVTVPVDVVVQIKFDELQSAWGSAAKRQVEKETAAWLATTLDKRFQFWKIQIGSTQGLRTLVLTIEQVISNQVSMSLVAFSNETGKEILSTVWLSPGDIEARGYPADSLAVESITSTFVDGFDLLAKTKLEQWLMATVPIAKKGNEWIAPSPTLLSIKTPLDWDEFQSLRISEFRIACRVANEVVPILAKGVGSKQSFDVLVVNALRRLDGNVDIAVTDEYELGPLYLYRIVSPTDFDFFED